MSSFSLHNDYSYDSAQYDGTATPSMTLSDLSEEILIIILSHLKLEDINRLARINSDWLQITRDKFLWLAYSIKIGALPKLPKDNPNAPDEYEDFNEKVRAQCVDSRIVERNWEKNQYHVQHLTGHIGSVRSVSYSDDILVSTSEDGTAKVWSIATGKCVRTIFGHQGNNIGWVYSAQYKNGIVVTGAQDRKIKIWQINSYFISTCSLMLQGHEQSVLSVQFDNQRIVSGSSDKSIKVWDINTGQLLNTLLGHENSVYNLHLIGDGLLSASADYTAKVWDLRTGANVGNLLGHKSSVHAIKMDPRTNKIFTGSSDLTIGVWQMANLAQPARFLDGHKWHVLALDIVEDKLISAAGDQTVRAWDINTEKCTNTISGQFQLPISALQADQRKIVAGSYDKTIKIFHFGRPFCA